jgi:branched-chain amino acid transport system substrate-binding protein
MPHNRLRQFLSFSTICMVAVLSIGLSACGGSSGGKDLVLATELPVSGTDAGNGLPTQHGVELAVSQANLPNGYKLTFRAMNDVSTTLGKHDPTTGQANITKLVSDPKVIAAVGPFNSNVAGTEIPVVNRSGLVLISPSNTNPGLTVKDFAAPNGFDYNLLHPAGKKDYYFRIPGNDVAQGKLLADLIPQLPSAGGPTVSKVYVVDDNEAYGKGLADQFQQEATAKGLTIVGSRASIDQTKTATFPTLASTIVAAAPDLIFYGGVTSNGGPALKQAVDGAFVKAHKTPVIWEGGDGIADDSEWITQAGASAINTFGSVAAPDVSTLGTSSSAASKFITDYKTKFNADPIPYSAMAYDAAMIEITAIKNVISAGKTVTREAVRDEVAKLHYNGVTGSIFFDENGDNAGARVFSIWLCTKQGDKPTWVFQRNVSI